MLIKHAPPLLLTCVFLFEVLITYIIQARCLEVLALMMWFISVNILRSLYVKRKACLFATYNDVFVRQVRAYWCEYLGNRIRHGKLDLVKIRLNLSHALIASKANVSTSISKRLTQLFLLRRNTKSSISHEERLVTSPNRRQCSTCRMKLTLLFSHRKSGIIWCLSSRPSFSAGFPS